ncbi:hypothetical protein [Salinirarus marinus]|uniref:hypothetical protein n=1 Tax=Salinirarus marinus TaxID=3068310 RepID=UPI003C6CC118
MGTRTALGRLATAVLLWFVASTVAGYALYSVDVLSPDDPFVVTLGLMALGGGFAYLSAAFVSYYGGGQARLF